MLTINEWAGGDDAVQLAQIAAKRASVDDDMDGDPDEPIPLRSVGMAYGTPIWPAVKAAVDAAPDAQSDDHGLWWTTHESALRACHAATKATCSEDFEE